MCVFSIMTEVVNCLVKIFTIIAKIKKSFSSHKKPTLTHTHTHIESTTECYFVAEK